MFFFIGLFSNKKNLDHTYVSKEVNVFNEIPEIKKKLEIESFSGPITAYGPDCLGCIGYTASGYNVKNNIYYDDKEYGKIRIVAADKSLPFGTIIKIRNLDVFDDDILAIVLDRGSAIGFNRNVYFDLLYPSERETSFFGKRVATFDILRRGY